MWRLVMEMPIPQESIIQREMEYNRIYHHEQVY